MRKSAAGAAFPDRRPALRHAVLHLRPRSRQKTSAVIEGPFDAESDALEAAARLMRRAATGDRIELLSGEGAWLTASADERAERAEELARRLLRRIRKFPGDFDPHATNAEQPPGALFALACMEAPRAARRLAGALEHALPRRHRPAPALLGQLLLDVPHETAVFLHAVRWPASWFAGRGRRGPDASRPADAPTACAVLARRLRRNHWPGRRTALSHRIPEELYEPA